MSKAYKLCYSIMITWQISDRNSWRWSKIALVLFACDLILFLGFSLIMPSYFRYPLMRKQQVTIIMYAITIITITISAPMRFLQRGSSNVSPALNKLLFDQRELCLPNKLLAGIHGHYVCCEQRAKRSFRRRTDQGHSYSVHPERREQTRQTSWKQNSFLWDFLKILPNQVCGTSRCNQRCKESNRFLKNPWAKNTKLMNEQS